MITARTRRQLLVFVLITLIGVSFVGARYARLDRVLLDREYAVDAHFADSGGVFEGAEVTYRGIRVGRVSRLDLTRDGVDVVLDIEKSHDRIPAATKAVVGNKSAVGEQYVELQPKRGGGPFLRDGSEIAEKDTAIPISTTELLTNTDRLVRSVPQGQLRTVISELGTAFEGTGPSLGQIVDTSNSFIRTADANFDTTTALIRDSETVLRTQSDKASAIRSFSRDLSLFSGTLADNDKALRRLIEDGGATATQLRTFLRDNRVELGQLLNNLVTTGDVVVRHLKGIRQILVIYPYVVEGSYSVVGKGPDGRYDANFGLILTQSPGVCHAGYGSTDRRRPQNTADRGMNEQARCTEPATRSSARGAQHAPDGRAPASYRTPVVATYDQASGKVTWTDRAPGADVVYRGGAHDEDGDDSWTSLLLGPLTGGER